MTPSPEQMAKIRSYAVDLILKNVPYCRSCSHPEKNEHYKRYHEIVEAMGYKWAAGAKGTTCGFLCHWMLFTLGVTNKDIVNWTDPDPHSTSQTKFTSGKDNISKLYHGGNPPFNKILLKPKNPFSQAPMQNGPSPGDIIHIINLNGNETVINSDHVFVFLSNNPLEARFAQRTDIQKSKSVPGAAGSPLIWMTAESGQGPIGMATDALLKTRAIYANTMNTSKIQLEDPDNRYISGWLDLSQLDYDANTVKAITGS
jgi:hypothetical protein